MVQAPSTPPGPPTGSRADARVEVPDALRADVRALGDALGEVLRDYGGQGLLDDVEALRELSIAAADGDVIGSLVAAWPLERARDVARAFTVYFHLVNLAEQYHRIRTLRSRDVAEAPLTSPVASAVGSVAELHGDSRAHAMLADLRVHPVLTAHPTEARRRAVATAIRRVGDLLARRDDPRLGASELAEVQRRLVEEVDALWRTAQVRPARPGPLDEVRTAMAVFDEVLFRVVPVVYRRADSALQGELAGTSPPVVPAFVRLGSWIGGDRDGNPSVTAQVTRQTMAIQADHVLRALEAACTRIGRAMTLDEETTPASSALRRQLAGFRASHPDRYVEEAQKSPHQPHRVAMLLAAGRLAATRARDADLAYRTAGDLLTDLRTVQRSLDSAGARRQAYGELQHLVWQVETFGFHLAELEVRQHSQVHAAALAEVRAGGRLGEQTEEVLEVFRTMAGLQSRFGPEAARRYVVSFTRSADDLAAVLELAATALDGRELLLDVVPLFETRDDLDRCVDVLEEAIRHPVLRRRLSASGRRLEVMLGYSDSAKDVGPASATLALYEAQSRLAAWAQRHAVHLTLFHGRGGALGRGGGPANRAVLAQAPGSVAGRFKVTEQGEAVVARYGDPDIALRHLEQVASAVVLASTPAVERRSNAAATAFRDVAERLDAAARDAYHALVRTEGFAEWFATVTPLEEIGTLNIGSRPARRGLSVSSLADLRAIPWVFSWSQVRLNLPGWYGLGSGLQAVGDLERLRRAYAQWPLFTVLLENAEMSLAKSDQRIARRYLDLGERPELADRVLAEHELTTRWVLDVTGHEWLLQDRRVLGRAVALRNPYVDALSHLQVRALTGLRRPPAGEAADADDEQALRALLHLTVNGIAAGLQNTG